MPDDYPQDADLPLPEPQPISDLGPLVVQARTLMERLQIALEQATGKQHRQRLRRALRRTSQRTLRRLRAEKHEPPSQSTDEEAQEPALPPLQSVLVGRSHLTQIQPHAAPAAYRYLPTRTARVPVGGTVS